MNQKLLLLSISVMLVPGIIHAQSQKQIHLGGGFVLNTKTYQDSDWKMVPPARPAENLLPVEDLHLPKPLPKQTAGNEPSANASERAAASNILASHAKRQVLQQLNPGDIQPIPLENQNFYSEYKGKGKKELTLKDVSRFAKRHAKTFKKIRQKRKGHQNLSNEELATWFQFEQMRAQVSHQDEELAWQGKGMPRAALRRLGVSFSKKDREQRAQYEAQAPKRELENQKIQNYNLTINPTLN